jgi:hypothetical protein
VLFESPDVLVDAANISEKRRDKCACPPGILKCASGEFAIARPPKRLVLDTSSDPTAYGEAFL